MKKKLLVLVMALASVVAVTGCEKKEEKKDEGTTTVAATVKKLECSKTEDGQTTKEVLEYSGDSITKATITTTMKFAKEKDAKEADKENKEDVEAFNKLKGVNATNQQSGTTATATATFKVAELDDDAKLYYSLLFSNGVSKAYDAAKAAYEADGYTCK